VLNETLTFKNDASCIERLLLCQRDDASGEAGPGLTPVSLECLGAVDPFAHDPMPVATSNEISCIRVPIRIDAALRNSAARAIVAHWLIAADVATILAAAFPWR
jgi:hypothetical protein